MESDILKIIKIEIALLFRNKRPKMYFIQTIFTFIILHLFLFVPILKEKIIEEKVVPLLLFVNLSGIFLFANAFFTYSFWSSFFSLIHSRPIKIKNMIIFKYFYYIVCILVSTIVSSFIIINIKLDIRLFLMFALYNISLNTVILLYIALYNIDKCDLTKGTLLNFEAWGAIQCIVFFVLMIIPVLVYKILSYYFGKDIGIIVIIIFSIINILFHRQWLNIIINNFKRRKFNMLRKING